MSRRKLQWMRRQCRQTATGILGAIATLLLHSLFFAAAVWSGGQLSRHPDRPEAIGASANVGKPEGDAAERRIAVQLLTAVDSRPYASSPPQLKDLVQASMLEITGPDALPLPPLVIDQQGIPAESTQAELIARAKMVGIYESQIRARIERAWTLPAEIVPEQEFTCRALIRQDRDGRVREVELPYEECNVSAAARQSLIQAIFVASPLPAPPHVGVFVDSFTLVFNSSSVRRAALTRQSDSVASLSTQPD